MSQAKIQEFLDQYKMRAETVDVNAVLHDFASEMQSGLNAQASSLKMLPSYISSEASVPANKPVIVLDAGGTNLRVCTVSFDENGNVDMQNFAKYQMPGIEKALTKEAFYNAICDYLEPVIDLSDSIGFCFSYPSDISPEKDGKLIYWTKEVKVPEVVGEYIGAGLLDELAKRGYTGKKIVLLNDTVSCLLAGKAVGEVRQCSGYIGFILGTGTNTAYVEANANIGKITLEEGSQVINVESGNFAKCAQGEIDKAYDATTDNPDQQTFEKMISGRYLGDIVLVTLKQGVKDALFSDKTVAVINNISQLETAHLSMFLENPYTEQTPLSDKNIEEEDREAIYFIILEIVERAAKLAAINISAAAIKSGTGTNPLHPICINVDGSTFHKLYGFRSRCESYLAEILNQRGIYFYIIEVENAPVLGSAIAGLVG